MPTKPRVHRPPGSIDPKRRHAHYDRTRRRQDPALAWAARMLGSARWQRLRAYVLAQEPLCRRCKAAGKVTAAVHVHHQVRLQHAYRTNRQHLAFDLDNLEPICRPCHAIADRESREQG